MVKEFDVVDRRKDTWSRIPHYCLALLSHPEYKLYGALESFRNRKTGQLNPSLDTLATRAGVSLGRIAGYLKAMEAKHVIEVSRRHRRPSDIIFIDPPEVSEKLDTPDGVSSEVVDTPVGVSRPGLDTPDGVSNQNKIREPDEREERVPRKSAGHASLAKKWTPEQRTLALFLTKAFRDTVTVRRPGESPPADTFGRDLKFWLLILVWLNREGFGEDHARGMAAMHIEYCMEKNLSITMIGLYARRELLHHEQIKREENRKPTASKPPSFGLTYD